MLWIYQQHLNPVSDILHESSHVIIGNENNIWYNQNPKSCWFSSLLKSITSSTYRILQLQNFEEKKVLRKVFKTIFNKLLRLVSTQA